MSFLYSGRIRPGLTAAAAILLVSAASLAANAQEITVTHAQGETVLPGVPETVLTFDIAALETLDALGVEIAGLPTTGLPDYLSRYAGPDYPKIGSLFEPDFEAVNALEPDLIIVAGRSSTQFEPLSAIAPTIDVTVDWTNYLGTVTANTRTLAGIFGKDAEAEALLAELDASVELIRSHADEIGNAFVVMTSGGRLNAYGPGSRFGWVHDDLGVPPTIEDVEAATHGEAISFEFLLETNPDWLIVIDRDAAIGEAGAAAAELLDNELVRQTAAWQSGQIIYVDPVAWYIVNGGLVATQNAVDQLVEAFGIAP